MVRQENRIRCDRKGFTLVELMVVIVIICLLLGLLMPVLSGAYRMAMSSADSALISQLSMACEMYNKGVSNGSADAFGEYPPSTWSSTNPWPTTGVLPAGWPPPPIQSAGSLTATTVPLTGAAKLFSCLSGFNTMGVSGSIGCNDANPANWQAPCGQLTHRGILKSEDKVYGPFYEPNPKQQTDTYCKWTGNEADQTVFASRFARKTPNQHSLLSGGQETGAPILYYRANAPIAANPGAWDIYDYHDNFPITDPVASANGTDPYSWNPVDTTIGKLHPLYAPSNASKGDVDVSIASNLKATQPGSSDYGITMPNQNLGLVPWTPYNSSTYILISPGPDGLYFTADDITNFR